MSETSARGCSTEPQTSDGGISIWLDTAGIMHVKLPEYAAVAGRHAAAAAEIVQNMAAGRRRPLLLDLRNVASISRNARRAYGTPVAVTAYGLLGQSPVDRVLGHFLLGMETLEVPARFFDSEPEALEWLKAFTHAD